MSEMPGVPEGMPMIDGMPDMDSPEFRSFLINQMLERLEHLMKAEALVNLLLDLRSPEVLARNPNHWQTIRSAAKSQKFINEFCRGVFSASSELMDDEASYTAVGNFTKSKIKEERDPNNTKD